MIETLDGNLYDYPSYYDLVYGSDWKAEFQFLTGCFQQFARIPVNHVLEPACGTGRLLYRLAASGLQVSGLDLNPHAVDYCNQRLQRKGFQDRVVCEDMTDFQLASPVDAGFNMINSFRHLVTHEQAVAHLRCMAEAIKPGGIYVLGIHLTPTEGEPTDRESWAAQQGHLSVTTELACMDRDPDNRLERFSMTYDIYTPTRRQQLKDSILFRTYTARQFLDLIAEVPGWEIVATYDFHYQLQQPIEVGPTTEDVVYVLHNQT